MSHNARTQYQRLETRLRVLGGVPSTAKSIVAHILAVTPASSQIGYSSPDKTTQNLMIAYGAAAVTDHGRLAGLRRIQSFDQN